MIRFPQQPQRLVRPRQYWIDKGLVYADDGRNNIWQNTKGYHGRTATKGTPKITSGKYGFSLGFGSTLGGGTTDRIDGGTIIKTNKARSIVSFHYALSSGGNTIGRIFQPLGTSALDVGDESMYVGGTSTKIYYNNVSSTGGGNWYLAGIQPLNQWVCYGITHDKTIGVTPQIFENGVLQTTGVSSASSGSYSTTSYTITRGNRSTDDARNFDGIFGPFYMFDGLLTKEDHLTLYNNPWDLYEVPPKMPLAVISAPAIGTNRQYSAVFG